MRKISYIKNKKGIKIFVDPLLRSGGILRPRKRCILLWSSIMISPYGELLVCPMLDKFVIGDLAKEGIMKLWNSAGLNRIRNLVSKKQLPICEECCVQRRDIFDHLKDPANFKRVFVTRKTRRSIYQHRIHI
jgi:MoaA/NifB/PqqE/SkfB family radical SAM enzyme